MTFNKLFENDSYRCIFAAFRDQRVSVRDTAADCINICLNLISERESKSQQNLVYLIYEEIKLAFNDPDPYYQHSCLTVLSAILSNKGTSGGILKVRCFFIDECRMKDALLLIGLCRCMKQLKALLLKRNRLRFFLICTNTYQAMVIFQTNIQIGLCTQYSIFSQHLKRRKKTLIKTEVKASQLWESLVFLSLRINL